MDKTERNFTSNQFIFPISDSFIVSGPPRMDLSIIGKGLGHDSINMGLARHFSIDEARGWLTN